MYCLTWNIHRYFKQILQEWVVKTTQNTQDKLEWITSEVVENMERSWNRSFDYYHLIYFLNFNFFFFFEKGFKLNFNFWSIKVETKTQELKQYIKYEIYTQKFPFTKLKKKSQKSLSLLVFHESNKVLPIASLYFCLV